MKTKFYIRLVMVCASFFFFIGISAQQTHLAIPIVDGMDDAEEAKIAASGEGWEVEVGDVSRESSDLEIYWDDGAQLVSDLMVEVARGHALAKQTNTLNLRPNAASVVVFS